LNKWIYRWVAGVLVAAVCLLPLGVSQGESVALSIAGFDRADHGRDWNTNAFFSRWAERFGVSLTLHQSSDLEEWTKEKAGFLTGSELPDALFKAELTAGETEALYQQGKIIDLRPLLETHAPNFYALLQEHPEWEKAIALPDGAIPALPGINQLPNNNVLWINQRWLDNLGLSMPTTAEELHSVLMAFRDQDPNQNGRQDEIPLTFSSMWDLRFLGHAFGMIANDYGLQLLEDGTVWSVNGSQEQRHFLAWLHDLWSEKLLDQNGFVTTDQVRKITDEKAAVPYGVLLGTTPLSLVPSGAMEQYQVLQPLIYQGGQKYRSFLSELTRGTFAISSSCKDPEKVLAMVDFLYTEEGARMAQAGLEGEDYQVNPDGTWVWNVSGSSSPSELLAHVTIAEGGTPPGMVSLDFQLAFEDGSTHRLLTDLSALKKLSTLPFPLRWIPSAQQEIVDDIQMKLGSYAEESMVHFVTGEMMLNDASWSEYRTGLVQRGAEELARLFQRLLDSDQSQ